MRGYLAWDDKHLDDGLSVEFSYTRAYQDYSGQSLARRELECLRLALPAAAAPLFGPFAARPGPRLSCFSAVMGI